MSGASVLVLRARRGADGGARARALRRALELSGRPRGAGRDGRRRRRGASFWRRPGSASARSSGSARKSRRRARHSALPSSPRAAGTARRSPATTRATPNSCRSTPCSSARRRRARPPGSRAPSRRSPSRRPHEIAARPCGRVVPRPESQRHESLLPAALCASLSFSPRRGALAGAGRRARPTRPPQSDNCTAPARTSPPRRSMRTSCSGFRRFSARCPSCAIFAAIPTAPPGAAR